MTKAVVVGSGIAGLTCSLYLARAGIETTVITGDNLGGNTVWAEHIENYTGFPDGIAGENLMAACFAQAENAGVEFIYGNVTSAFLQENPVTLNIKDKSITADYVVLATGTVRRKLGIPKETELTGKGAHYCAVCDGNYYRDKVVGVVGGGESAVQEALYLSSICKKVYMFVRKPYLRACKASETKIKALSNIEVMYGVNVAEIAGERVLKGVLLDNNVEIALNALFIAIGYDKSSDDTFDGWASNPNVYKAGSCTGYVSDQIITSAGDGAEVALKIINDVNKKGM